MHIHNKGHPTYHRAICCSVNKVGIDVVYGNTSNETCDFLLTVYPDQFSGMMTSIVVLLDHRETSDCYNKNGCDVYKAWTKTAIKPRRPSILCSICQV